MKRRSKNNLQYSLSWKGVLSHIGIIVFNQILTIF